VFFISQLTDKVEWYRLRVLVRQSEYTQQSYICSFTGWIEVLWYVFYIWGFMHPRQKPYFQLLTIPWSEIRFPGITVLALVWIIAITT
jgi:hypothetical protein